MTSPGAARHVLSRIAAVWRVAYGAESRRAFGRSVTALPHALAAGRRAVRGPRPVRALAAAALAVPVALAASALTGVLAFLVLINVVAYPFRAWLGLPGRTDDIWASRYVDSWGGPTLAGAWATHAGLLLLLVVPAVAWAVRGLTGIERRLTAHRAGPSAVGGSPAHDPAPVVDPAVRTAHAPSTPADATGGTPSRACSPGTGTSGRRLLPPTTARPAVRTTAPARGSRPPRRGRVRWYRVGAVVAATGLLVTSSLTAHAAGIGDNLLWTPRDAASSLALTVTLAPLAALLLLTRTAWWRLGARPR